MPARQRDPRGECGTFRYVDIASINRETKQIENAKELACEEAPSRARKDIRVNDLLVSTVRPNLNAVAQVTAELDGQIASTGFAVLRPDPKRIHPRYLFFRVITDAFISDMVAQAKGAGYPAVSDRIVSNHKLPLPPLPEQHRIVEILDQADALRRQRREADELSEKMLPALVATALTKAHKTVPLSEIAHTSSGGTPSRKDPSFFVGDIPWVKSGELHNFEVTTTDEFLSEVAIKESAAKIMPIGTILVAMYGATVGAVSRLQIEAATNQAICCIQTRGQINQDYIYGMLKVIAPSLVNLRVGGAQPNINQQIVRDISIPIADERTISMISTAVNQIATLRRAKITSATTLETLFQTLLHRAFDGSLTAKWREGKSKELLQEMEKQAKQ